MRSVSMQVLSLCLLALCGMALASCSSGGGSDNSFVAAEVSASIATPDNSQAVGGDSVAILYFLFADPSTTDADIAAEFSVDGGVTFDTATAGAGGDGTSNLRADADGESHLFVWDSAADLGDDSGAFDEVQFRVRASDGSAVTTNFTVSNVSSFNDPAAPTVTACTATAVTGLANDVITVTFSKAINAVQAVDAANFTVNGGLIDLTGCTLSYDNATFTTTIILDGAVAQSLGEGDAYDVLVATVTSTTNPGVPIDVNFSTCSGFVGGDNAEPELAATIYEDSDNSDDVSEGDTLYLVFDESVELTGGGFEKQLLAPGDDLTLEGADTLGAGATVEATDDPEILAVILGAGAVITEGNDVTIAAGADFCADNAGNDPDAGSFQPVTATENVKPGILGATATSVSGQFNDTLVVQFTEDVLQTTALTLGNFRLQSPVGEEIALQGSAIDFDAGNATVTITLINKAIPQNLVTGSAFKVIVSNVKDLNGNVISSGTPFTGTVVGDSTQPALTGVVAENANANGIWDAGDKLHLTFDEAIAVLPNLFEDADISLPVSGDRLGTSILQTGPMQATIILGTNPVLTVNGTFNAGTLTAGSPSGLGISAICNSILDLAGNAPATGDLDITNSDAVLPGVTGATATAVSGVNNDQITVTFSEAIVASDATNVGNYTLESPNGTNIVLTGATVTYDAGSMTATITLDANAGTRNLRFGDTFTVTVSANIRDLSGNSMDAGALTAGGAVDGDNTGPQLIAVMYIDNPTIATVDAADQLILIFDEAVDVSGSAFTQNGDVTLPVAGDSLGASPSITTQVDPTRLMIDVGAGVAFTHAGTYVNGNHGAGQPSGLAVAATNDKIMDLAGNLAQLTNPALDIVEQDLNPPQVSGGAATTIAGLLNDVVTVTFNEQVNSADAQNPANFALESPTGTARTLSGAEFAYDAGSRTTTITLDNGVNLKTGNTFRVTVTGVRDLFNNTMTTNNTANGNVGGDATGPTIASAVFTDVNSNGNEDSGDTILLTLSEAMEIAVGSFTGADLNLPVTSDSVGTTATITQTGDTTVRITLGTAANLTVFGTFNAGTLTAGSPSGLGGSAANNAILDAAGNALNLASIVDITNTDAVQPTVTNLVATAVSGFFGDTIAVTFSEDVVASDATTIGNYAFENPTGTARNISAGTVVYSAGTRTATITLGSGVNYDMPFGSTCKITVTNVRDLAGNPVNPPAIAGDNVRTGNVTGDNVKPQPTTVIYRDIDTSSTVNAGDQLEIPCNEHVDTTPGNFSAADINLPVAGDSLGASPTISELDNSTVRITLGAGASLTITGSYVNGNHGAGQPSGLGFTAGNDSVFDPAGNRVDEAIVLDLVQTDAAPPQVSAGSVTAVSGFFGDVVTVTFNEQVNTTDATTLANFAVESPTGTALTEAGANIAYDSGTRTTTITFTQTNNFDFTFGATFKITVTGVRDLFNNTITTNNTATGNVAGDSTAPVLQTVVATNVNSNGIFDSGDTLLLTFNEHVTLTAAAFSGGGAGDVVLPVTNDTLGTGATIAAVGGQPTQLRITLGTNPVIDPNGTYNAGTLIAGSPSGFQINSSGNNDKIVDPAGNKPTTAQVDIANADASVPTVTAATATSVTGAGNDGFTVTFSEAMTESQAENLANFTLQSPDGNGLSIAGASINYDPGTLTTTISNFTPNLQTGATFRVIVNSVNDLFGNRINGAANFATGNVVGDSQSPILQSSSWVDADSSTTVTAGDGVRLVFDEAVVVNGGAFTAADIVLPVTSDSVGAGATIAAVDATTLQITLGAGPVLTPGGTFNSGNTTAGSPSGIGINAANNAIFDAAGNLPETTQRVDIASVDNVAPTISFLTLCNIQDPLNGRGAAGGTLQTAENLWTIDMTYSDTGGSGINTSNIRITSSSTVNGNAPGTNLTGLFTAGTVDQTQAHFTVPGGVTFPTGATTITVRVFDNQGNPSTDETFDFTVQPRTNNNRPFEQTMRWLLLFDRDDSDIGVTYDGAGTATMTGLPSGSGDPDGVADYERDHELFGLFAAATKGTVVPNTGGKTIREIMLAKTIAKMEDYMENKWFAGMNVDFYTDPAELPAWPGGVSYTIFTSANYSRISIGGRPRTDDGNTNAIGTAFFDNGNPNDSHFDNYDLAATTSILGVFPARDFEAAINGGGPFRTDFDPFLDSAVRNTNAGGAAAGAQGPVGNAADGLDPRRVEFVQNGGGGTALDDIRTQKILNAIDKFALRMTQTLAHECGHSMSLVANDPMPNGLYGGDSTNFNGSTSHHIKLTVSPQLFVPPAINVMAPASAYSSSQAATTDFNTLIKAYLKEQVIINASN